MNVLTLFDGIHIFGDIFKERDVSELYEEDATCDELNHMLEQEGCQDKRQISLARFAHKLGVLATL